MRSPAWRDDRQAGQNFTNLCRAVAMEQSVGGRPIVYPLAGIEVQLEHGVSSAVATVVACSPSPENESRVTLAMPTTRGMSNLRMRPSQSSCGEIAWDAGASTADEAD